MKSVQSVKSVVSLLLALLVCGVAGCGPAAAPTPTPTPAPPAGSTPTQWLEHGLRAGALPIPDQPVDLCLFLAPSGEPRLPTVGPSALLLGTLPDDPSRLWLVRVPLRKEDGRVASLRWGQAESAFLTLAGRDGLLLGFGPDDPRRPWLVAAEGGLWLREGERWERVRPPSGVGEAVRVTLGPEGVGAVEETGPDAQAAPLPCRALAAGASLPALSAGVGVEVVAPLTAGGEVVPAEELARQYEDYLLLHDESRNLTWVLPKDFFGPYGIDPQTADGRLLSALLSSHPAGSVVMGEDFSRLTSGLQVNDGYLVVPIGENQLLVFGKNINGQMRGYRLYHREGETRWFAHDLGVPWNPKLTDVVFDPSSGQAVALSGYRIIHRYDLKNRSWQWLGGKDGEFVVVGDQRLQTATMLSALTGRCEENYSGWETLENLYSLDPEDVAALVSYLREGKPSERISVQETETYAVYHTETVSVFVDRRGEEGKQAYFILAHSQAPQLYETFLKLWQRMISENWFSPEFLYHITAQYGANVGGYQTKIDLGPRAASHTVFSCGKDRLVIGVAYYHKNYDNLEGMLNVFLGEAREIFVDQFFQTAPPIKTYPNDLPEKIEIGGYWFTVNPEVRERWQNREPLFVVAFDYNFWEREVVKDSNCPDRVKRQMLDILDGQLQTLVGDYLLNLR